MEPITRTAKPPSVGMSVAMRLVPGVRRVHDTIVPFAQAWDEWNAEALRVTGPLWVALGDSMSQGIGASDITGGWVGQLYSRLGSSEEPVRLVNLSTTGARVNDVLTTQLAQLRALPIEPDVVTVLVGANDMLRRSRRAAAVGTFRTLLGELPAGRTVLGELPPAQPAVAGHQRDDRHRGRQRDGAHCRAAQPNCPVAARDPGRGLLPPQRSRLPLDRRPVRRRSALIRSPAHATA